MYGAYSSLKSIRVVHGTKYKGLFSIKYREQGSHERGVYRTQDTLRMGTVRVKREEEAEVIARESKKSGRTERGHKGVKSQTRAEDLTMELPEGRESPYHRLD